MTTPWNPPPSAPDARRRRGQRVLSGSTALVTGGSSGVGRAIALELARRGVRVLATARRADRLAALAAEPLPTGAPAILVCAGDITSPHDRRAILDEAARRLGGLDILVAAAGSGAVGAFAGGDPDTLRRVMEIDFVAPAELVRESLPLLRRSVDPAIVFVGSILGHHPLPLHAEYCAAKAALRSLAGSLRQELAAGRDAPPVDVVLASLGPTESEFWDNLVAGERPAWSRGRPYPAAATAAAVATALVQRRPEVLPGWSAKGFAIAARFFPRLIDAIVRRRLRSQG
jgi:short-subunit dehydrogenase